MITLWRKQNYRNVRLSASTLGERVAIVERDGTLRMLTWMGFVTADAARAIRGAVPVRLLIERIGETEFRDLRPGEYVQGCRLDKIVWAVLDFDIRIVPGPERVRSAFDDWDEP